MAYTIVDTTDPVVTIKQATRMGLKAKKVSSSGPGGGWPEVRIEGDRALIQKFLDKNDYDQDIQASFGGSRRARYLASLGGRRAVSATSRQVLPEDAANLRALKQQLSRAENAIAAAMQLTRKVKSGQDLDGNTDWVRHNKPLQQAYTLVETVSRTMPG